MARRVSSREAQNRFGELLRTVVHTKEPVIVERHGKPYAEVIAPELVEEFQREAGRDWAVFEGGWQRNAAIDPDEVYRDVTEVVEAVRREWYERAQAAQRRC
ncbi:MAG: type II toxin-antitoxin system Phd/YefM family antitoxin [Chloroflexota bacterium]|nr:type II toxin-antitoxin system Phd/YefM family antitoxin [Dehalococcoidia bacterium]MDW8252507.1 type II toxin-antitoxin system Phd/YefM family antitoxin [Chloroflexota bacterium]